MKAIGMIISVFLIFAIIVVRPGSPQERSNIGEPNFLRQQAFQPINLKGKILYRFDPQHSTLNKTTDANKLEFEVGFNPGFHSPNDLVVDVLVDEVKELLINGKEATHTYQIIKDILSSPRCAQRRELCIFAILGLGVLIIFGYREILRERRSQKANNNENGDIQQTHLPAKEGLGIFDEQTHRPA